MEIALVDDMNYDRDKLYQIISYYLNIKNIDCTIYTYSSAEEFLKDFFKHKFIMVFLDISMSGMTGMHANSGFFEQLTEWVLAQNDRHHLPRLGGRKEPLRVSVTSSGYIVAAESGSCRMQLQLRLEYYQPKG